jgi:hypothetical protein
MRPGFLVGAVQAAPSLSASATSRRASRLAPNRTNTAAFEIGSSAFFLALPDSQLLKRYTSIF